MSEHLRQARFWLDKADELTPFPSEGPTETGILRAGMWALYGAMKQHMEAQQETPASETSSAPTTGPAEKPLVSSMETVGALTGSLGDSLTSFLEGAISDFFNWHPSTSPRMGFRWIDGETLQVTFLSRTGSGKTKAGDRGVAVPDSPASSPEPAQGGSEGWPFCKASGWVDAGVAESLLVQCDQKPGHVGDHYDSSAGRAFSSRTMKEGSERG